jgi:hypothetical protein
MQKVRLRSIQGGNVRRTSRAIIGARRSPIAASEVGSLTASWSEAWARKISGPLSRNHVNAVGPWESVSRLMSRRLKDIGAVAPWGYVSGPLSRNDEGAIATWDCVSGPVSRGLHNIALRLSRADKGQHRCCQNCFLHNAPPLERGHQGAPA